MSIPEMDMNPEIARKLLEVGEEFRIEGPFFSYEEIKMGNVNHTYKVNYIRDDGTGMAKIKSFLVPVSYTHLTLPTMRLRCRSRWSPYH